MAFVPLVVVGLLIIQLVLLADTTVANPIGHHHNDTNASDCPRISKSNGDVVEYKRGTERYVSVDAEIEYTGPSADLSWQLLGPNPARQHLPGMIGRFSPHSFGVYVQIWNISAADWGRYRLTVQLRNNVSHRHCAVVETTIQVPTDGVLNTDINDVDDGSGEPMPIVLTRADGTDSPTLTVHFRSRWSPKVEMGPGKWNWPNADRIIVNATAPIRTNQTEYSLRVANATEADLGIYWFIITGDTPRGANIVAEDCQDYPLSVNAVEGLFKANEQHIQWRQELNALLSEC